MHWSCAGVVVGLFGMTGDRANDAPTLEKVNVGVGAKGPTHAGQGASVIALTSHGLSNIAKAILDRKIFQRMRELRDLPDWVYTAASGVLSLATTCVDPQKVM